MENNISLGLNEALNMLKSLESIIQFSVTKLKGKVLIELEYSSFKYFKTKLFDEFLNFHKNTSISKNSILISLN